MIGTMPWLSTWRATSNCCATTAAMPAGLARLITERSLVPNTPSWLARSSRPSRSGIGFIIWTPSRSSSRPLSTLMKGTTPRSISARGVGLPLTLPSMVRSNRIAPITLPDAEAGRVDDPAAHLVDEAEHFLVAAPRAVFDAIARQGLGRGTARLVERGDKAVAAFDFRGHFRLIYFFPCFTVSGPGPTAGP